MASNKTKLSQSNKKSSMAALDLNDFDDIFDDKPLGGDKKSPIKQFMSGFKDSVLDKKKTKSLIASFTKSAMPDGFARSFGMYDDLKQGAVSLKDHLEKTNPGDLMYLAKRAQSMLPTLKDKVSESNYERINGALSNKVEQYKYQIDSNRDQIKIRKLQQEAADEETIRGAMDQNTMIQRELFNRGEHAEDKRWQTDRVERSLRDSVQNQHQAKMAKGLAQAVDSLTRMASYNEQVNYDFQRKGLELQYRSFMQQRDQTKLLEASMDLQNKAFQAIVRNTALPDHLKSSIKDLMSMNARQGIAQGGMAMAGRTLQSFLGSFGGNVQNKVNGKASGALSSVVQGLQTGEGMKDMWGERYNIAGQMAGDQLHSFARNTLAPMAGRALRPRATALSNKHGGRHNQAGYLMDNAPAMLQEFVNNYNNSHGAKGVLQDMLRPFVPQFGQDTTTKAGNYQTIGQHTAFNQLTQRTITEIIPGFQAKILRELRMIRTGKDDVSLETFDITTGKFKDDKDAMKALQDRVITKQSTRMVSQEINETLESYDPEKKLSPGARRALSERLLRDSGSNKRFDPKAYGSQHGYKEGTSKETLAELQKFFKGEFEFDDQGQFKDTAANHEKRQQFSQGFLNIRNVSRDPSQEIHRLIESGNTSGLRQLGLLITEEGQDRINWDMIRKMQMSGVLDTSGPNGPGRPDASGDHGDKNFVGPLHPGAVNKHAFNAIDKVMAYDPIGKARGAASSAYKGAMGAMGNDPLAFAQGKYSQAANWMNGLSVDGVKSSLGNAASQAKAGVKAQYGNMQSGGLPAIMSQFNPQQKIEFAQSILQNAIDKEPPAMREARVQLAAQIMSSVEAGKEYGQKMMQTETGQKAMGYGAALGGYGQQAATAYNESELKGKVDLCVGDSKEVAIKAIDMMAGKLTDVNTGKVIETASDITGEVRNQAGQMVLSATEAARGLYSRKGELLAKAQNKVQNLIRAGKDAVADADLGGKANDLKDWFVEGKDKVAIRANDLLNGEYFDQASGKMIETMSDIKGTIVDSSNRVVVTAEELAKGLKSRDGQSWGLKAAAGYGKLAMLYNRSLTTNIIQGAQVVGKTLWALGRNTLARMGGNRDAYMEGDDSGQPALTVEDLKAGMYIDAKGKQIEDFKSVKDTIYDEKGNPVVEKKNFKKLVDLNGKPHIIAKNQRIMRKIGNAIKAPFKALGRMYWKGTKAYYRALGKGLMHEGHAAGRTLGRLGAGLTGINPRDMSTTDQVLVQILDTLKKQEPEKFRKGSWQERAAKEAEEKKEGEDGPGGKGDAKEGGFFKKMMGSLGGLFGRGKKKDEEEEDDGFGLDDAADVADIGDAAGDANERRKNRKRGRGRGRGGRGGRPKVPGRLGKLGGRIAGSRVGQMVGSQVGRLAATRGGMMVATTAARFLPMLATGLASLVSAPVLLGAAAVAVVGIGGYMLWKRYDVTHGDFRNLRMLQYGVSSIGDRKKVLALEELLEKSATKGQEPEISLQAAGGKAIIDAMGIDIENEAEILRMGRWIDLRFKPIMLTWIKALDTVGKKEISINEVDDKMDDSLKGAFLKEVQTVPQQCYDMTDNPFGDDDPLPDTREKIKEALAELGEKYKVKDEKAALPGAAPKPDADKAAAAAKVTAATGAAVASGLVAVKEGAEKDAHNKVESAAAASKIAAMAKGAASGVAVGVAASATPGVIQRLAITGDNISGLDAIRMRAYGMETLNKSEAESIMAMETRVDLTGKRDQAGQVKYTGDLGQMATNAGSLFGLNTADHGPERTMFLNWLRDRFIPVCEAFLSTARTYSQVAPDKLATALKPGEKVNTANAIMGMVSPTGGSIWSVPSIFKVVGKLEELKEMANIDLDALKKLSDDAMSSPTQSAASQAAGAAAAAAGKSFVSGAIDGIKGAFNSTMNFLSGAASSAWDGAKSVASSVGGAIQAAGNGVANAASAAGGFVAGVASGVVDAFTGGSAYGGAVAGNGGSWEKIPMPASNKSGKAAYPTLKAVAEMVGIPVEYLLIFASMESGFDYTAKNPLGSATGWYQFIDSTWDGMIAQHSKKYGLPPDQGRRLRLDPRINALMGAEYMKYSMTIIQRAVGRQPNDVDLYMAHFLGPGTAVKWLRMNPNTIGIQAFPKEARYNPYIFTDKKSGKARTLAEIYKSFDDRMIPFRKTAADIIAGGGGTPSTPGATGDPDAAAQEQAEANQKAMTDDGKGGDLGKDANGLPVGIGAPGAAPSATGSTPTTAGAPGSSLPVGVGAPGQPGDGAGTATGGIGNMGMDAGTQTAAAMASAKDAMRGKEVEQANKSATENLSLQQQQLDTQKSMLDALLAISKAMSGGGAGNSMSSQQPSTQQTRSVSKGAMPVPLQ